MWYLASRHTEKPTGVSYELNNFCVCGMWYYQEKVARKHGLGKCAIGIASLRFHHKRALLHRRQFLAVSSVKIFGCAIEKFMYVQ